MFVSIKELPKVAKHGCEFLDVSCITVLYCTFVPWVNFCRTFKYGQVLFTEAPFPLHFTPNH